MPNRLTPVNDALAHLLAAARPRSTTGTVPLESALALVLADDVIASVAVPAFDNSAMDGYAVNHLDCQRDGVLLKVSQYLRAGQVGQTLQAGTAARIFTGAPLPAGATAVVMQENARAEEGAVRILQVPRAGENVRRAGHDVAGGSMVLQRGHRLQPQDIGLLASLGLDRVAVYTPLKVALVNTGDELQKQGQPLKPGQLYDSNSFTLAALLQRLGMQVVKFGIVGDDLVATTTALRQAAANADCVISTGGVSVGDADHVRAAVEALGRLSLWKLAIKPGKPFSFGHINNVPFMGLPGNPVAVFITFTLLVQPFLLKLQGAAPRDPVALRVKAGFAVTEPGSRQEYLRVRLQTGDDGFPVATLYADQSSSVLTSVSWADGLAIVPVGVTVQPGQWLDYLPFGVV